MIPKSPDEKLETHMTVMFSVSAGLVGVCLTCIGLFQVLEAVGSVKTLGDELLAADALLFLVASVSAFLALRLHDSKRRFAFARVADWSFLGALAGMASVCVLVSWIVH